jgi:hypothetical protein
VALVALGAAISLATGGCRGSIDRDGTPLEQTDRVPGKAPGAAAGGAVSDAAHHPPAPVAGPSVARPDCALNRKVTNPGPDAPESAIAAMYAAALGPDDEAGFQRFYANFLPKHNEGWVREQYWPRLRQHVHKYVVSEKPLSFHICRETRQSDGGVKMFVRSNDSTKSDPPIAVVRTADGWRVDTFTY